MRILEVKIIAQGPQQAARGAAQVGRDRQGPVGAKPEGRGRRGQGGLHAPEEMSGLTSTGSAESAKVEEEGREGIVLAFGRSPG